MQFADGKTKAFINDRPVSTALLRELGRRLVEIHGQHDERALLDPTAHRYLLDQFGGLLPEVREVTQLWERWRELDGKAKTLAQALELPSASVTISQPPARSLTSLRRSPERKNCWP